MKVNTVIMILSASLLSAACLSAQQVAGTFFDDPNAYLGQKPPAESAVPFKLPAAGTVKERIAISRDGKEIYYTEFTGDSPVIKVIRFTGGAWSTPVSLFPGHYSPALSPDGKTLFMEPDLSHSWYSTLADSRWSAPARTINGNIKQYNMQQTDSGRCYATSDSVVSIVGDISLFTIKDGHGTARTLGAPVNSPGNGADFFMARDESYVVIVIRNSGYGAGDLFISFKKPGGWTDPVNLGPSISSSAWEYGPYVSPDGKYIFFTREGQPAIYWARFDTVIADLRKRQGIDK